MASSQHTEPYEVLSEGARDVHRAIMSVMEELEAVDYYHLRADVTQDEELKSILVHNRNEEIEHAAMVLEWLRRRIPEFDQDLRTYLFTTKPITEVEKGVGDGETQGGAADSDHSLGLRTLKGE
ncbi:hypothetical protein HQ520_15400 [bacterium]|nr:hypothetical protein [bacterium]